MNIDATNPLFLNSQHLLIAVVATIAAEHGVERTRELVDELADNDLTWAAIEEKVGGRGADELDAQSLETEPPPAPEATDAGEEPDVAGGVVSSVDIDASEPLSADGIESAGPDGISADPPSVWTADVAEELAAAIEPDASDLPPIDEPPSPALLETNGTRGKRGKKSAHA